MDWSIYDQEGAMRQRYLELDDRTEEAREAIAKSGIQFSDFQTTYDISWIYHENGLEGVVLTYPEIRSAIDNKIVSDVSLLPTYRDIKAQKTCIDTMRERALNKKPPLTIEFLREMHGLLINEAPIGNIYRKDIPIHRTYFHEIVQPSKIEAELQEFLVFLYTKQEKDIHPIEHASNVHHRFMRCFPFSGTSGLIGRLILNYVLMMNEYFPVVIHSSDRQRYYEALRGSQRDFRGFVCEAMENAIGNAVKFFTPQETKQSGKKIG